MLSVVLYLSAAVFAAEQSPPPAQQKNQPNTQKTMQSNSKSRSIDEGFKYRAEGRCDKAIESFKKARRDKQFIEDWAYYYAVADCYTALGKYDDALHSYTRIIESTKNRTLIAEMYKERAKAYYMKASGPRGIDKKLLDLTTKDLDEAKLLGMDISDMEKIIALDKKRKQVIEDDTSAYNLARPALDVETIPEKKEEEMYNRIMTRLDQTEKKLTEIKQKQELMETAIGSHLQDEQKKKKSVKKSKKTSKKIKSSAKPQDAKSKTEEEIRKLESLLKEK
jgi:tetratricopeptide (TPR) repeat protein